jgi:hypothetical protein
MKCVHLMLVGLGLMMATLPSTVALGKEDEDENGPWPSFAKKSWVVSCSASGQKVDWSVEFENKGPVDGTFDVRIQVKTGDRKGKVITEVHEVTLAPLVVAAESSQILSGSIDPTTTHPRFASLKAKVRMFGSKDPDFDVTSSPKTDRFPCSV